MTDMNGSPTENMDLRQEVATRLRRTREAFGMQQGEFASAAGIAFNTYNQYEQGARLMRLECDGAVRAVRPDAGLDLSR